MIEKLRFKKLLNEYKSLEYEQEMIKEILKEAHLEFEVYYRQWCALRDIDLGELNKKHEKKVEKQFGFTYEGLVPVEKPPKKEAKHKDIYKALAKKIHPDKLDTADKTYWSDYMDFKDATEAIMADSWGKLFEIADKHDIYLKDYESICSDISEDIEKKRSEIQTQKCSYSYKLYECKDEPCKDKLVRAFLFQLFGWKE